MAWSNIKLLDLLVSVLTPVLKRAAVCRFFGNSGPILELAILTLLSATKPPSNSRAATGDIEDNELSLRSL